MKQWMQEMRVSGDDEDESGVKGDDGDVFGMEWIESWVTLLLIDLDSQSLHVKYNSDANGQGDDSSLVTRVQ